MSKIGWWIGMDLMSGAPIPGGLLGRSRRRRRRRRRAQEEAAAQAAAEQAAAERPMVARRIGLIPGMWMILFGRTPSKTWKELAFRVVFFFGFYGVIGWAIAKYFSLM